MILLAADGPVKVLSCSSSYLFPTPIGNRDTPRKIEEKVLNGHSGEGGLLLYLLHSLLLKKELGKAFPTVNFHVLLASLHPYTL